MVKATIQGAEAHQKFESTVSLSQVNLLIFKPSH